MQELVPILIFLAIGAVAGFFAGQFVKGSGSGLFINTFVGVLGAFVGGYMFRYFGINIGVSLLGEVITATAGATVLLLVVSLLKQAT